MRIRSSIDAMAVAALGLLAVAALTGGTSASFTATTVNPSNLFSTATLSLSNDKSTAGSLVSLSNVVPGDTANRTVTITNTGNVGFTFTGGAAPQTSTSLWTDTVNGLQVSVKRGLTVLYTGALKNLAIPASPTVAPAATDTLTFDFNLPTTADNTFQGLTQTFTITYTATQLAGTAR